MTPIDLFLTLNDELHEYRRDGRIVPSVTQLLDRAGLVPPEIKQFWTDLDRQKGQALHAAIQYHDEGTLDEGTLDPMIGMKFMAYQRFLRETGCKTFLSETSLYSETLGFAGTIDRIGWIHGREQLSIIDWKGWTLAAHYGAQLAGYAILVEDNLGILGMEAIDMPRHWVVVSFGSDGKYRMATVPPEEHAMHRRAFLSALSIHNYLNRKGR